MSDKEIEILLVEDNPGDVRLMTEVFKEMSINYKMNVVGDGVEALKYLKREDRYSEAPRPNLILLDLYLPRKNGHEVLREIKSDEALKYIPVVILSTSSEQQDIGKAYDLYANCYITKPADMDEFAALVKSFKQLWLSLVTLPKDKNK